MGCCCSSEIQNAPDNKEIVLEKGYNDGKFVKMPGEYYFSLSDKMKSFYDKSYSEGIKKRISIEVQIKAFAQKKREMEKIEK